MKSPDTPLTHGFDGSERIKSYFAPPDANTDFASSMMKRDRLSAKTRRFAGKKIARDPAIIIGSISIVCISRTESAPSSRCELIPDPCPIAAIRFACGW